MITSIQNDKVKNWKKLQKRKERRKSGTFLVEGFHLVEEARKSEWQLQEIIVQEGIEIPSWCRSLAITEVGENVFQYISETRTPQGIAAIVSIKQPSEIMGNYILLIDAIQDPGNLGTIIRTADAAGFDAVVLGDGTVDLFNDKVIRSTQGSIFHIPITQEPLESRIKSLQKENFSIWATALTDAKPFHRIEKQEKVGLIVGNEGAGIHENILEMANTIVNIPIYGKAESLNVSVAAGILMYHVKM
ncbi:RNA methyltransferase, TrmH family [Oceanobacillus limi]|uniref:RNA methyltransferase, TrmH family n=1 Tax=Oceanobacillus limi TaxID=930131 RepID=A0A1I0EFZ2_9BACI|nr:RNA methyltransferase [Oceanobacillus limi]SET43942.1 RNA methyltransferase, TrmH family [Oceanobacillus limi]